MGNFYFDLEADLTELFHWNNKQLFVYILAEYETTQNDINQVVVWDRIIKRGEKMKLNLKRKVSHFQGRFLTEDIHELCRGYSTLQSSVIFLIRIRHYLEDTNFLNLATEIPILR